MAPSYILEQYNTNPNCHLPEKRVYYGKGNHIFSLLHCAFSPNLHQLGSAQGPCAARAIPHPRPQPGPGPGISLATWAEFSPSDRRPLSAIDLDRTAVRLPRWIKTPPDAQLPQNHSSHSSPSSLSLAPPNLQARRRRRSGHRTAQSGSRAMAARRRAWSFFLSFFFLSALSGGCHHRRSEGMVAPPRASAGERVHRRVCVCTFNLRSNCSFF